MWRSTVGHRKSETDMTQTPDDQKIKREPSFLYETTYHTLDPIDMSDTHSSSLHMSDIQWSSYSAFLFPDTNGKRSMVAYRYYIRYHMIPWSFVGRGCHLNRFRRGLGIPAKRDL